jgi:hypothetical protein
MIVISLSAQDEKKSSKSEKSAIKKEDLHLFKNDQIMDIYLRFGLSSYIRKKSKTVDMDAVLTFNPGQNDSIRTDIKLRSRGEFRNQYCYMPPVELNFKKSSRQFAGLNKIKLVVPCNTGSEYEDYILREYLIYKLYNVLTDTSFRVRLLNVNILDTEKKRKPTKQYGFFIEPLDMMAKRTNSTVVKSTAINQKSIRQKSIDRVAIFNYMVGNYDWAVPNQHNVRVLKPMTFETESLGIAVPYDFDWTGLVNAAYAIPAENVGTQSVRERIFLGICRTPEMFKQDLEEFIEKKEKFYNVIRDFAYLDKRSKQYMISYLDEFYNEIETRNKIIDVFLNSCKRF